MKNIRAIINAAKKEGPKLSRSDVNQSERSHDFNASPIVQKRIHDLTEKYQHKMVKHKSGDIYEITHAVAVETKTAIVFKLVHVPVIHGVTMHQIKHERSVGEFFDEGFTLI